MKPPKTITVFVVEQEGNISFLLNSKLQKSKDYIIVTYRSYESCVENLGQKPDLIILDDQWTNNDPLQMAAYLKHQIGKTPLVFMSSQKSKDYIFQLSLEHVENVVAKDMDSDHLADELINKIVLLTYKNRMKKREVKEATLLIAITSLMLSILVLYLLIY
jgi:DNA-binding NarL/FixJ family response regulator